MLPLPKQGIPSHLRDLEPGRDRPFHGHHAAAQQAKPFMFAEFIAPLKQELHPEADAEKRFALSCQLLHNGIQTFLLQLLHGIPKGADARQDHPRSGTKHGGVGCNHRFLPQKPQGRQQGKEIPYSVIYNSRHHSTPFVLGTASG